MTQNLIAIALVALAGAYLVRKLVRSAQGRHDGGCDKCSCNEAAPRKAVK